MTDGDVVFMYSPLLLTEDGVFEVACDGRKFITKINGILTLIDSISLTVIEEFSTYPEAKNIKFSPNSQYISFINQKCPVSINVIDIDSKEVYTVGTDQNFLIEYITWSQNSLFIVFCSELDVYTGVYFIGKNKVILEGSASDEFKQHLCCFNPNTDYFSIIKNDVLYSYCTETWEIHSIIKCPVNPIGFLYTDSYTVAVWTSGGNFVVMSLLGENKFERISTFSSCIKSAKICQENRVMVVATYDDKVELFDVLSWEKLYSFEYPLVLSNAGSVIWNEMTTNLQFSGKQIFIDHKFERKTNLCLSTVKNISDEFKMKTNRKFLLSFSKRNRLLASCCPGFPSIVWIRNLKDGKLAGVLSINEGTIQGFKWHPTREILAIITLDSVIIWMESKTFVIYCKYLLKSFYWVKTKLTICGLATEKECMLVYFRKR